MSLNKIGQVISCSPSSISIAIDGLEKFEENKKDLQIGRLLKISQGNSDFTIATIRNIKGIDAYQNDGTLIWQFQVECQAIGTMSSEGKFDRGSLLLPVPTEPAYIADHDTIEKLFAEDNEHDFPLGKLSLNKDISLKINGNRFFGKHIAIVGSTGSGKSCTVAKILQDAVGISESQNKSIAAQNNSHIVIFDIHDEYTAAFNLHEDEKFSLNRLDIDSLQLPYWLMNSEELESMFIESNESNSHNQVSQFKNAVTLNKEKHNPSLLGITYDTPVYFSIKEVYQYIENLNREIIGRLDGEDCPKLADGQLITNRSDFYFDKKLIFVAPSTAAATKAGNGPFNGEFNRFASRLETKLSDKRLKFLLDAKKSDGTPYKTDDFTDLMKQFIGYLNKSNVTIIDLSGIPFEVLSITVSLVSRLIFDFCFHYSKLQHAKQSLNDIPVMIVCEEAHNYIPRSNDVAYRSSRKSIERIAKEGRKYGLSLMIVSQRPSEVSETIFAQCNNFLSLRLTNDADQNYVKRLFPDNTNSITDILPNLSPGECIAVGDAILLPAVIKMPLPSPEPHSSSVKVHKEWKENWKDIKFDDVIKRWRKEQI
ncbi:TPA: ATP-binding protein [Pseudomonas aeruginosa]|uniref:ATP-binding protein n=1 Tax=Pseudomonas aeruginosa TaxID=287 RepID=UPI00097E740E|nr:ATP-binding protein [Pseudomonas aeruginosa]MBG6663931.1 ATP-binding protein [Pseudomonas aeruginosa]MEC5072154.1 ATP-binding protein [Pseudomonas aeruginosa]ONN16044.1 ATPase [Pseudomonas aeruginosa]TEB77967.1 ATP-binding protein [Pseudomonas aeruginosa]TEC26649.1 ATP-binding protein [Pseudomonas aeruginosa]